VFAEDILFIIRLYITIDMNCLFVRSDENIGKEWIEVGILASSFI